MDYKPEEKCTNVFVSKTRLVKKIIHPIEGIIIVELRGLRSLTVPITVNLPKSEHCLSFKNGNVKDIIMYII